MFTLKVHFKFDIFYKLLPKLNNSMWLVREILVIMDVFIRVLVVLTAPKSPETTSKNQVFSSRGEMLELVAFWFTGSAHQIKCFRDDAKKDWQFNKKWHRFPGSNQLLLSFFLIHAQRPKINPKFVLEAHSSLAQDCRSSLICCFSLCPFPIQSVSFQLCDWVDTLFHPQKNPTENTAFWSKWPCLPVSEFSLSPRWWCSDLIPVQPSRLGRCALSSLGPRTRRDELSSCHEVFSQVWSLGCLMICVSVHACVCYG